MKIANFELTKEQVAAAASAVAAIAGIYLFLYRPTLAELGAKSSACSMLEKQVCDARCIIASVGKTATGRDMLRDKEVSFAINELTEYGKALKITFRSIKPREFIGDPKSGCNILPVEMAVEGGDRQMLLFMGSLDELKKSLITVESFDVAPTKEDPSRLKATITADMYFLATEELKVKQGRQ